MTRSASISRDDIELLRRVHVTDPMKWADQLGTDYWIGSVATETGPLASSQGEILSEHGWVTTSLTAISGSAADFMTSTDVGAPGNYVENAQNDVLDSPSIFGDYVHAHAAATMMGWKQLPRYLICETYATFSAITGTAATTAVGMVEDGGTGKVSADSLGTFYSDGTNFLFNMNGTAGTSDAAFTAVTTPTWFRIIYDQFTTKAYPVINTTKLIAAGLTFTQDEWPAKWSASSGDATNLVLPHSVHIYYSNKLPFWWTGR